MELTEQMLRFFVAGVVATTVDFSGYNVFVRRLGRNQRVAASMLSVTVAMGVSFLLNRFWVFSDLRPEGWPILPFLSVTLTSAYGIQSAVIYVLSTSFRLRLFFHLTGLLSRFPGLSQDQTFDILERNVIKLVAVAAGLVWNFSWYRWYVFV